MEEDEDEAGALAMYVVALLFCTYDFNFTLAVVISQTC